MFKRRGHDKHRARDQSQHEACLEEETALREVTSRKNALGGRSQTSVGEYPRMTYVLSVATNQNLDLPRWGAKPFLSVPET